MAEQGAYEQWKKFWSIAYDSFDVNKDNFVIHIHLSVFSKMLAYAIVRNDDYINNDERKDIIDRSIFHPYNICHFVDNDFFYRIKNERSFAALKKVFRLLAQEKKIVKTKTSVHINIILANTLLMPEGVESSLNRDFKLKIGSKEFLLNIQMLEEIDLFDKNMKVCKELADQTPYHKAKDEKNVETIFKRKFLEQGHNSNIAGSFYKICLRLKKAKEANRDSIGKFILQNIYKPHFLQRKVDYIISNPHWLTYNSIKNEEYQNVLNSLAKTHNIKPDEKTNFPHLAIATIFLSHYNSYFLQGNGKIAFARLRSFFSANYYDNTPIGKAKGFCITTIWHPNNVVSLLKVPDRVLIAPKTNGKKSLPATGPQGKTFTGNLPVHNCNLKAAARHFAKSGVKWRYAQQGKASASSTHKDKAQTQANPYKKLFKQRATIVPRTFYFAGPNREIPPDLKNRIINLKTPEHLLAEAPKTWNIGFKSQTENSFFYTALSKSILPFALNNRTNENYLRRA